MTTNTAPKLDATHAPDDAGWYKDAVIYQLHVKAYRDSNDDGIGDFAGLIEKLDYLQQLGVTAVWLLPFYPSPLRDDGYDIADYCRVHRQYGSMRDFRQFVRACHHRGLRVITELVINHTSDQHPWFQRARHAKAGSVYRDYYVWSDTDERYAGTRIIFIDAERSNWTWDEQAQAFYWHRFYSHQPDLNFDNPRVLAEVKRILRYWLAAGVDGLRLDAVPYLVERDGTSNENLPETHAVLKQLRAEVDAHFPGRVLLAEANQWPEDVLPYFGDGDECHMAFHFPLMPRIYSAIAREDRHPVTDIMHQTPDIPDGCQWAIFLRNHDELTLEMVTERERDYLWNTYAADPRMRINLGIRRRLAPLMDNDRRKIELMDGLLFSLPGTPVMYYGDEIGMGDNVFLGDRDGVRTPMQWSPDRNGGFSRADPPRLYLPPIMDPIYGFGAINIEAQSRSPSSLLNWTRRMLGVRREHPAFGRGSIAFLYPGNRKILAYVRAFDDDAVLCVFNLSGAAQAVELDLSAFKGRVPIELSGHNAFPPIGEMYYLLTLPAYGFHWFLLATEETAPKWHEQPPDSTPDFITLVARHGLADIVKAPVRRMLEEEVIPSFLADQRWFADKHERVVAAPICCAALLDPDLALIVTQATFADARTQRYFLPLSLAHEDGAGAGWPLLPYTLARMRNGSALESLVDASAVATFARAMITAMRDERTLALDGARLVFTCAHAPCEMSIDPTTDVRLLQVEQSNTSIRIGETMILKLYRKLVAGPQPEVEICRFLTDAGFANAPALLGSLEHIADDGTTTTLAVAQAFVHNQGDGWEHVVEKLVRRMETVALAQAPDAAEKAIEDFDIGLVAQLGRRTAELHRAFAAPADSPAFGADAIGDGDRQTWRDAARDQAERAFALLAHLPDSTDPALRAEADHLLTRRDECLRLIDHLAKTPLDATKTRIHGDYHLGQVLLVHDDWVIVDFEGDPRVSLDARRAKQSPLRDIAGMLRSFAYAAQAAQARVTTASHAPAEVTQSFAQRWRAAATDTFLGAYRSHIDGVNSYPGDMATASAWLELFTLDRACGEIVYEAGNRPDWLALPVHGVIETLNRHASPAATPTVRTADEH